jgi:putative membrane-bound dehydrogenase-like protein
VVIAFFGEPEESETASGPYWRRNYVSSFLLELTSGGAKGLDSITVPEGFEINLAAGSDLVRYPVFASMDDRGRLFVCESAGKNVSDEEIRANPEFRIRLVEDVDGDGVFDQSKVFADKITLAMGAQWYRGKLYSAEPPDVVSYEDTDNDGVADRREVILTGWPLKSNATTLHGPYLGPDGWMYLTYSPSPYEITTKEGTVLKGPQGRVFRALPDGARLEWFVGGGFDNPVEVVFTDAGETIGSNTYYSNPKAGVRDSLLHYVDGGVYPKWRPFVDTAYQQTGDYLPAVTLFARVAPAGLIRYRSSSFGPDYQGNLFSAQFNPHRVQRHILRREGGTFRTDDEDFITSTDIDVHLTDIVEDADGSLLIVDTGGWYLHSCPVSRVAKPQFTGAIYRLRKTNAPRMEDPWGKNSNLADLPPEELARFLDDPRPMLRDKALDLLIQAGVAAVGPLSKVRESAASPEVRAAAVFGLARLRDPAAGEAVRAALSDSHFVARVAAARMAGLNKDGGAVERLMEMVKNDHPAVRRQAAEALGRIGDERAVPALVAASGNPEDRFVEHSIIYALIRLNTPGPLVAALKDRSPRIRQASLIALDQMEGSPLKREHLISLLGETDERLGSAVLWVAAHHPDWSRDIVDFLRARLRQQELSAEEMGSIHKALLASCSDQALQQMMADLLADPATGPERRLFILDAIDECSLEQVPSPLITQFKELIKKGDPRVRQRIAVLIGARGLADLDEQWERIAYDDTESNDLRTASLQALVSHRPEISDSNFNFLLNLLKPETEADLRLSVAQVLGKARLSEKQLLVLARSYLPHADPLILPTLLDAYRDARGEDLGRALVEGLLQTPESISGMAGERLERLLQNLPRGVRTAAKPLLARVEQEKQSRAQRLTELEPLLTAGGDLARGRQIFFGKKVGCSSCHTLGDQGGDVGPDLTAVGAVRSGLDILEAIVFPSASFVPGHEVYRVTTAREVYTGVRGESADDTVVIISGPRDRTRIPRKDIVSMEPSPVSLMPDGFDKDLTKQELTDLLAFLQAQKSRSSSAGAD